MCLDTGKRVGLKFYEVVYRGAQLRGGGYGKNKAGASLSLHLKKCFSSKSPRSKSIAKKSSHTFVKKKFENFLVDFAFPNPVVSMS